MNYFTLDGHSTTECGIGLSAGGAYDAPARKGESISVPGRNGNIWVDDGSFENIMLTYPCWMSEDFDANIDDFRVFLSLHSDRYYKLTDTYHPGEYRLARYAGAFTPQLGTSNKSGRFDVVFDCYPQRFLDSGNTWTALTVPSTSSSSGVSMGTITNDTLFATSPVICFNTNGVSINSTCVFTFVCDGVSNTVEIRNVYGGTSNYYYLDTEDYSFRRTNHRAETDWRSLPKVTGLYAILDSDNIKLQSGTTEIIDKSTSSQTQTLHYFGILPRWATI